MFMHSYRRALKLSGVLTLTALLLPLLVGQSKESPSKETTTNKAATKSDKKPEISAEIAAMMKDLPPEALAMQKIWGLKTLDEKVTAAIDFVSKYPDYSETRNVAFAVFYDSKQQEKKPSPDEFYAAAKKFLDGTANAPNYLRCEFNSTLAKDLDKKGIFSDGAIAIAQQGIALLSEDEYVLAQKKQHEAREATRQAYRKKNPKSQLVGSEESDPFSASEAKEHYRAFAAGQYATLGNLYLKAGKLDLSEEAYHNAYKIRVVKDASLGLSKIAEQRSDATKALDYYVDAMLTGKLSESEIAHLRKLYTKANSGSDQGLERYLDDVYLSRYKNPLPTDAFTRTDSGQRAVVAELVTGAGCEPCMSVDMAFEAALKRYKRSDLILLALDWHAPSSDPLSNAGVESRVKYYDVHGAPTLFLDGKKANVGEGAPTEAERVFANLKSAIEKQMAVQAKATISVTGRFSGGKVEAKTKVTGLPSDSKNLRLHVALVSQEVSYSGENGLRFHPMVMRSLARSAEPDKFGFPISSDTANVEYVFDLEKISAENLKYYDWYIADLKERTHGMVEGSFKEKRNVIEPHNLAVIAFVQDDTSKEILQGCYAMVPETTITAQVTK